LGAAWRVWRARWIPKGSWFITTAPITKSGSLSTTPPKTGRGRTRATCWSETKWGRPLPTHLLRHLLRHPRRRPSLRPRPRPFLPPLPRHFPRQVQRLASQALLASRVRAGPEDRLDRADRQGQADQLEPAGSRAPVEPMAALARVVRPIYGRAGSNAGGASRLNLHPVERF